MPASVKQILGDNTRKVVDRFIGQRANAFPDLGADRLLAESESDIESEIVNVGHVQPPTAHAPGRPNSARWTSPVKMPAAGVARPLPAYRPAGPDS
jgi:hypothetical protein